MDHTHNSAGLVFGEEPQTPPVLYSCLVCSRNTSDPRAWCPACLTHMSDAVRASRATGIPVTISVVAPNYQILYPTHYNIALG